MLQKLISGKPWYRQKRVWAAAAIAALLLARILGVPIPVEAVVPTLLGLIVAGDDDAAGDVFDELLDDAGDADDSNDQTANSDDPIGEAGTSDSPTPLPAEVE